MKQPPLRAETSPPRCPRCDEVLAVSPVDGDRGRGLVLACPEPYCDYLWAPTRSELARLGPLERSARSRADRVAQAAG
jgi:hypothetical protein